MTTLSRRYASGEHREVWAEMRDLWRSSSDSFGPDDAWVRRYSIDRDDAEDVMRQTFDRVAQNVDTLIDRLRATGYRFESEAARYRPAEPPRIPAAEDVAAARDMLDARYSHLETFSPEIPPFPLALQRFGEIVGSVNLAQRYPPQAPLLQELRDSELSSNSPYAAAFEALRSVLDEQKDQAAEANEALVRAEDRAPHPHADDPVLSRLGDWDPLVVNLAMVAYDLTGDEAEPQPLPDGGLGWWAEFAPSFEHKANISGAINPYFVFPRAAIDPLVQAEGIELPFTEYLRRCFERGGFFGVPRPILRDQAMPLQEIEPGIYLPKHPIFAELSAAMMPF